MKEFARVTGILLTMIIFGPLLSVIMKAIDVPVRNQAYFRGGASVLLLSVFFIALYWMNVLAKVKGKTKVPVAAMHMNFLLGSIVIGFIGLGIITFSYFV